MESLKDILYDDTEQKFIELQDRKKRRKRRWKLIKWGTLGMVILLGSLYFFSDYSKVKSLTVLNSKYYSEQEILNKAGLDYDTRYLLAPGFYIEHKLEEDPLIKSADVTKNMQGNITITVHEKKVIGYMPADDENILILLGDGSTITLDKNHLGNIVYFPLLNGFDKKELKKIAKSFNQSNSKVSQDMISMIAEIQPFAMSYDDEMLKLRMQDGNRIYTSMDGVRLLNTYKNLLEKLRETNLKDTSVCIWADELNWAYTASAQNCP